MCNIPVNANFSTIFKYTQKPLRAFICGGKQLPFPRTSKTSKDQILSSVFYPGFIRLQNKHDDWWYGKNSVESYIIICVKDRKKCCIFNGHFLKINSHPDICLEIGRPIFISFVLNIIRMELRSIISWLPLVLQNKN